MGNYYTRRREIVGSARSGGFSRKKSTLPWTPGTPCYPYHKLCEDVLSPRDEYGRYTQQNGLHIFERKIETLRATGICTLPGKYMEFTNFAIPAFANYWNVADPAVVDLSSWQTEVLANLNPRTPVVDIPVMAVEMKDLPGMLRNLGKFQAGDIKPADVPELWLSWSFGWLPLLSDLRKLVDFAKHVNDRAEYMNRLRRSSSFSRTLNNSFSTSSVSVNFGSRIGTGNFDLVFKSRIWFTATVSYSKAGLKELSGQDANLQAAYNVLGLNVSAATIWEAFPWSWLSDYFFNIGTYLDANRNKVAYNVTDVCIMAQSESSKTFTGLGPSVFSGGLTGGTAKAVRKQRKFFPIARPGVSFRAFLSKRRMGILGALFSSRVLK